MPVVIVGFYLTLPLILGGMVLILCLKNRWLSWLRIPVDANRKLRGKPLLGNHKTWQGFVLMSLTSSFIGAVLWLNAPSLALVLPFETVWQAFAGFGLVGLAYSVGELPNSFIKRQMGILPGDLPDNNRLFFQFFDLIDGILLAGLVYLFLFSVSLTIVVAAMLTGIIFHQLIHELMIRLHLKPKY